MPGSSGFGVGRFGEKQREGLYFVVENPFLWVGSKIQEGEGFKVQMLFRLNDSLPDMGFQVSDVGPSSQCNASCLGVGGNL